MNKFLLFLIFTSSLSASDLSQRFEALYAGPQEFFTEEALPSNGYWLIGHYKWFQFYGKAEQIAANHSGYQGYVLHADPYVFKERKISFLTGSDCSHFVHRVYQLMGANYPFLKTRDLYNLAVNLQKGSALCEQELLTPAIRAAATRLELVKWSERKPGDILLYRLRPSKAGSWTRGHVALITENLSATKSIVLGNHSPKLGIKEQRVRMPAGRPYFLFRYKGPLLDLEGQGTFTQLMTKSYPHHVKLPLK